MRINIVGTSLTANSVRCGLDYAGLAVTDILPDYTIYIDETFRAIPVVDGIDCELERIIVNSIANIAGVDIYLARQGGVVSDNAISISLPLEENQTKYKLYERAIEQAVLQYMHKNRPVAEQIAAKPVDIADDKVAERKSFLDKIFDSRWFD